MFVCHKYLFSLVKFSRLGLVPNLFKIIYGGGCLLACRQPVAYTAQFQAGSDLDLSVSPQTGELLPEAAGGTTLKVTFKPTKYGRIAQGRLVIQV